MRHTVSAVLAGLMLVAWSPAARAANNGIAVSPALGWTSWSSLQTNVDEDTVKAMALIQASALRGAGYVYVNVDGGWYANPDVAIDSYGRWVADSGKFPGGMPALGNYIHSLGLKFGIYVTPGIPKLAVTQNTPVQGTALHAADIAITSKTEVTYLGGTMYYIDYTVPAGQAFVNSWANLFASWGVDYVKLDGVDTWNIPDVQAWSTALSQTGRPMLLALANDLDAAYAPVWSWFGNSWRISTDIESYSGTTLTSWEQVAWRFAVQPYWLRSGAAGGWNDLDSLIVGGTNTGLSQDERQTMATLWALSASPLIIGDDLRTLDAFGVSLLTNLEVIGVDQSGVVAAPTNAASQQQVWTALQPDGSYAVGLFNLGAAPANVDVSWSGLGFAGSAGVRDLWARADLGSFTDSFTVQLRPHASMMLRITPALPVRRWLASGATLNWWASLRSSLVSPQGQRTQYVGFGSAATFSNVDVINGGFYNLTVSYSNGDTAPRMATITVNGTSAPMVFPNTGSWDTGAENRSVTTTVYLAPGRNTIAFSNAAGWAPEFAGITIQPQATPSAVHYMLVAVSTGGIVSELLAPTAVGAPAIWWADTGSTSQHWSMVSNGDGTVHLVNRLSGYALEVHGLSTQVALLDQWPYDGGANQNWRPVAAGNGAFVLVNGYSGLLVSAAPILFMYQGPSSGARTQQWLLVPVM